MEKYKENNIPCDGKGGHSGIFLHAVESVFNGCVPACLDKWNFNGLFCILFNGRRYWHLKTKLVYVFNDITQEIVWMKAKGECKVELVHFSSRQMEFFNGSLIAFMRWIKLDWKQ